jgi:hypothetical protein
MSTRYCIVSNTGSIGGGLHLEYKAGSWRKIYPDADVTRGLDGDATRSIGSSGAKAIFRFVARAQYLTASLAGYASMEGSGASGQSVKVWAQPTSAALSQLKLTDPEGTNYDVVWRTGYTQADMQNRLKGAGEWMQVDCELWEK